MDTQNYKRTVAGSVGAGVGALFNGSGRTYYILEHKNSSKYHNAGESQKIIIDQIELGRDASCQVRFDESFETVSRKHAAIMRDGESWKLIHLSNSNPTLVNGRPISGTYYLQSGDEIQLSVNGPRMGFIVPQGRQALTSSIGLTERMSLFRKQALRPYRTAIIVLSCLLVLAVAGLTTWNYKLHLDNVAMKQELVGYKAQMDSLSVVRDQLQNEEALLKEEIEKNPNNTVLQTRLVTVQRRLSSVNDDYNRVYANYNSTRAKVEDNFDDEIDFDDEQSTTTARAESQNNASEQVSSNATSESSSASGTTDLKAYYKHIYTLKVTSIEIERNGYKFNPGISTTDIVCGTGFMLSNGTFVTSRQNIEPWIYSGVLEGDWRKELAEYVSLGCNVIINYKAYSTNGTAHPFTFDNMQFKSDRSGDIEVTDIKVRKKIMALIKKNGIDLKVRSTVERKLTKYTSKSGCYSILPGLGNSGIAYDAGKSRNLTGGQELIVAGFSGNPDIHNLSPYISYFTSNTSRADTNNGTIVLQTSNHNTGYNGSPAFIKESNGSYKCIGVMVGALGGEDRLVPIANCI